MPDAPATPRRGIALLALVALLAGGCGAKPSSPDDPEFWREARRELASVGEGFLVWESNRTGDWRLWTQRLDGAGLRQLIADEPERWHFCPHISPDGARVAFLNYKKGVTPYDGRATARLELLDLQTGKTRLLVDEVRSYKEDRAVVWIDPVRLCFIRADGTTAILDTDSGATTPLVDEPHPYNGWLVDPTLSFATAGDPEFSPFDAETRAIRHDRILGGCQPYFSRDGRWGFWIGGGGGPVKRIRLHTREVGNILEKSDPRMPPGRGYVYFPMLSACGNLLVFSASNNGHDHFRANYDLFVARIDPATLGIVGKPVRFTFSESCDRFPDVHLAKAPLGRHAGEAPFTVNFTTPGEAKWDFGDGGGPVRGKAVSHVFSKPGDYRVLARAGGTELRGTVMVRAAAPPVVVDFEREPGGRIRILFDEPVDLGGAKFSTGDRTFFATPFAAGHGAVLETGAESASVPQVTVSGVRDLAEPPNAMPDQVLSFTETQWPVDSSGLVFLWSNGKSAERLTAHGAARPDHDHAMRPDGGFFESDANTARRILEACMASGAFSIEFTLTPETGTEAEGPILSFGNPDGFNLLVGRRGSELLIRIRTPESEKDSKLRETRVPNCLVAGEANHIIVNYSKDEGFACHRNGDLIWIRSRLKGGFTNWQPGPLRFGGEALAGFAPWPGTIQNVALRSRTVGAREARQNYMRIRNLLSSRATVPRHAVRAKLLRSAIFPTLEEIRPYRDALVVQEFQVPATPGLGADRGKIQVARYSILNGRDTGIARLSPGQETSLSLEPFGQNPQVESLFRSEIKDFEYTGPLYFDISR